MVSGCSETTETESETMTVDELEVAGWELTTDPTGLSIWFLRGTAAIEVAHSQPASGHMFGRLDTPEEVVFAADGRPHLFGALHRLGDAKMKSGATVREWALTPLNP